MLLLSVAAAAAAAIRECEEEEGEREHCFLCFLSDFSSLVSFSDSSILEVDSPFNLLCNSSLSCWSWETV